MGLVRQLYQRLPSKKTLDEIRQYHRLSPRLAFLRRRIRLKGSSTITMPLGLVLLFPITVLILILTLFLRHPNSPGRKLIPSGAPPSIRYGLSSAHVPLIHRGRLSLGSNNDTGKSVSYMTDHSRRDASSHRPTSRERTL
jgi:hypothetical protein